MKKTSAIKVTTMKIMDNFCMNRSHPMPTNFFVVSKDEWDTKEGTGKSLKNGLHAQQYDKRHLLG